MGIEPSPLPESAKPRADPRRPGFALGQSAGVETVTLLTSQIPAHSHVPQAFCDGRHKQL